MRIPRPGDPDDEAISALIEAAEKAEAAGLKALGDCLKMVAVAQLTGSCETLRHHVVVALLETRLGIKTVIGQDDDNAFKTALRGFQLKPEED